jgi:hypothetical protein
MRLLVAATFVSAAWVAFLTATFEVTALIAVAFFCSAAGVLLWGVPRSERPVSKWPSGSE